MDKKNVFPVTIFTDEYVMQDEYSDEPYGSWEETAYCTIEYAKRGVEPGGEVFYLKGEPLDAVYAVTAIYSTGDSFGVRHGECVILDVFKDYNDAEEFKKFLEGHAKYMSMKDKLGYTNKRKELKKAIKQYEEENKDHLTKYEFSVVYNGKTFSIPYYGYFENLDSLDVKPVIIK